MAKINLLVLTDHRTHSEENSIYGLLREMLRHPVCGHLDVASRGVDVNRLFFEKMAARTLYGTSVNAVFHYREDAHFFKKNQKRLALRDYDAVLMRLPYPVPEGFWSFLETVFNHAVIVNRPSGIELAGNKSFLLRFSEICPPMIHCLNVDDIELFRQQFPVVLKPVKSYGGKGIVRIENNKAMLAEGHTLEYTDFIRSLQGQQLDYLGVKFLKNVTEGDKRVVVCNGEILGASLRRPKKGSWVCNVSQGGHSYPDKADADERAIIERIDPVLREQGVIFYGIDTLVNDDGKRVLSEINAASIGGIIRIGGYSKQPVTKRAAELLWKYYVEN